MAVHVHAQRSPGPGFEPIEPDLEDAYFLAIRRTPAPPAGDRAQAE